MRRTSDHNIAVTTEALECRTLLSAALPASSLDTIGKASPGRHPHVSVHAAAAHSAGRIGQTAAPFSEAVTGLTGTYYQGANFKTQVALRTDGNIDFNWRKVLPLSSKGPFSVRWTGQIVPLYSQKYSFTIRAYYGVRLWVGDQLVINDWGHIGPRVRTGRVTLQAGQSYDVTLDYDDTSRRHAFVRWMWSSASQKKQLVPQNVLWTSDGTGQVGGSNPGDGSGGSTGTGPTVGSGNGNGSGGSPGTGTTGGNGNGNGSGGSTGTGTTVGSGNGSGGSTGTGTTVGSGNGNGSGSTVTKSATTTILTKNTTAPIRFGQSVSFTATLAAVNPSAGTPTGTVTFMDGTNVLGTATLSGGVATFTTTTLSLGFHSPITAVYNGSADFNASTSHRLVQTVYPLATTLTKNTTAPVKFGQSVAFTATLALTGLGGATPTGIVTFEDGTTVLGTGTLSDGIATLSTTALPVGSNVITAAYGGDKKFRASTFRPLLQTVQQAATTTTLTKNATAAVNLGQSVTFTATLAAVSPGAGMPTGTVTFMDGTNVLGTARLTAGVATFTTTTLSLGFHPAITAVYNGDADFTASTSYALVQTVHPLATTLTKNTTAPVNFGQSITFTATLAVTGLGGVTPTGIVTFDDDDTTVLGTGTLSAGIATFSTTALPLGSNSITAVYGGDENFTSSSSNSLRQTVDPL